jgi:nitrate reductase delta subunit
MALLGAAKKDAAHFDALDRIKEWTRERFKLPPSAPIMVSAVACAVPGCPPLETVAAFWNGDGKRYQFKLFKPPEQVAPDDLPYPWLMKSLEAADGAGLDCC